MNAEEFFNTVYINMPKEWRKGQTAFNRLAEARPDLAEKIRGTPLDPFNHDDRLPPFEAWVRFNW